MSITLGNIKAMQAFTFGTDKAWSETAANTTAAQTTTVNGLVTTDIVYVVKPTEQAGLGVAGVRVSAANTLTIVFTNPTASGITSTAEEKWLGVVFKSELPKPSNAVI